VEAKFGKFRSRNSIKNAWNSSKRRYDRVAKNEVNIIEDKNEIDGKVEISEVESGNEIKGER
jgi:hypothetical protein